MREFLARGIVKALGPSVFNDLVGGSLSGKSPRLGTRDLLKAYSWSPWLRAVVNKAAGDVAGLTWEVKVATRNGKAVRNRTLQGGHQRDRLAQSKALRASGDLRVLDTHPLLDTIYGGANQYFQGFSVIELTQVYLDLVGEAAWLLERNPYNMPTTSYPIPPTWVAALPTSTNPTYRIDGPTGSRIMAAENVLWYYHPDPLNPYQRGSGIGTVLGDELETDEAAAKHTKAWFKNRAVPDILITGEFGEPEKKAIEQSWLNKLQGVAKAWMPFFLNREVKVEKLSQTFENMQLVELRKAERDIILQVYGLPPEVFGIIESSNRATIDAADYLMKRYVTVPRAEFLRQMWQRTLVPMFDEKVVIDYINPVAEDRAFELQVMQSFPWAARINEVRLRMGLDPIEGPTGTNFVIDFNKTILTDLSPDAPAPAPAATPPPAATLGSPRYSDRVHRTRRSLTKDDLTDAGITTIIRAVRPQALTSRGQKVVQAAVETFGQKAIDALNLGITFNLRDAKVTDFLSEWGAEKITGLVNETTRTAIRDTLVDGVKAGETLKDLAHRIEDVFDEADSTRAALIARTEMVAASNFGVYAGFDQGGVEQKEWLATQDSHVRDTHADLDGQIVGVQESFVSPNGGRALYPGDFGDPAEDCNCRCGVLAVITAAGGLRTARWKTLDADRRPWERSMRKAMRLGFEEQRAAALAALDDVAAEKTARVA